MDRQALVALARQAGAIGGMDLIMNWPTLEQFAALVLAQQPAGELQRLSAENDSLMQALADCREACPEPRSTDAGNRLVEAVGDPLAVPGYVKATIADLAAAAPAVPAASGEQAAQWIPVSSGQLPEDREDCIFYSPDLRNPARKLLGLYIDGRWMSCGYEMVNVTHWMRPPGNPGPAGTTGGATCTRCGGNDAEAPCAYPGEKRQGCLRDKRLASTTGGA